MKKARPLATSLEKCLNVTILNYTWLQNMSNVASILKILVISSHSRSYYGPSNLLFGLSDSCIGHHDKMRRKLAVMLTIRIFESYTKLETLLKVSRNLSNPPQNGSPMKFLRNCTEMLFTSNIINFQHIF